MPRNFQIENREPADYFLRVLIQSNPEFFFLSDYFLKVGQKIGHYFLNYLGREAHELETILDNAEVFTNELFVFRELVAGIRWFSSAAITLEEGVIGRYQNRYVKDSAEERKALLEGAREALAYLYETIRNLCRESNALCAGYGLQPPQKSPVTNYIKFQGRMLLEKNRVPRAVKTPLDAVEIVANEFLAVGNAIRRYGVGVTRGAALNEKDINQVLNGLHTLQSFYDSHLHGTDLEAENRDFWSLRGCIGLALRLTQLTGSLVHFYERHLLTTKDREIKEKLAALVGEEKLSSLVRDFALAQANHYVQAGVALSLDLLTRCTGRTRRSIKIPIGVDGIHARPMTWIHKASRKHGPVIFEVGGETFEAESMLSLLMMAEGIDRVIGLEDRESQIAVATGTVINELEVRKRPLHSGGRVYYPRTIINVLETFRDEIRQKAGTRLVEISATGPRQALDDIELMAGKFFRPEEFPERLNYLFEK